MASSRKSAKPADAILREALASLALLPDARRVAVAFSGGLDSTVLLQACVQVLGASRVQALHVAHGLQEAARDWPAHCVRVAQAMGVGCEVLPLEGQPAPGDSLEAWARTHRYAALVRAARAAGAGVLLTAHHADDQAETVLLRIARGTGVEGLAAIEPRVPLGEVLLVRPLLGLRRAELLAWGRAQGLEWVEDPSNGDTQRRRNQLRHEVLPSLEAALPGFAERLVQLAQQAQETRTLVEALARSDLAGAVLPLVSVPGVGAAPTVGLAPTLGPALDRRVLKALGSVRAGAVLRLWIQEAGLAPPTRARLQEMWRQLVEGEGAYGTVRHAGRLLRRHRDRVVLEAECGTDAGEPSASGPTPRSTSGEAAPAAPPAPPVRLRWQGEAFLPVPGGALGLRFEVLSGEGAEGTHGGAVGVPAEWLRAQWLEVRPPRARDPLRPHAGGPLRTLRKLFQERGIPAWQRPDCRVLECAGRVLAVAGLGTDQSDDWPGTGARVRVSWASDPRQPPV